MQTKHWKYAFSAFIILACGAAFAGYPIIPLEALAPIGMGVMLTGETDLGDLKKLLQDQGEAWEQFKKKNDERIEAIEKKGFAPADLVGTVDKINGELTKLGREIADIMKKANRPGAGKGEETAEQAEHKTAIAAYLRKGTDGGNLRELERKAMSSQSEPDGGYLVTAEMDGAIDRVASVEVAMRRLANVRVVGGKSYKKLVKTRGVSGGWLGEEESGAEGNAPQFSEIEIVAEKMYAEPWIPADLLEDADYDLESDITDEAGITFGEIEGTAFINGSGVKQPRGILSYSAVANANYAWGKLGYVASGAAADFAATNPADKIIDLQHSLKQRYRPGAAFLMADSTLGKIRQMKDGSGQYYLWQPDPATGFGGRVLGSPVEIDDYMPAVAANALAIAYGNFKRGYTIVDRRGIAVIRDSVTKKGIVKFHFTKRVGGGVTNFEAIKLFKIANS